MSTASQIPVLDPSQVEIEQPQKSTRTPQVPSLDPSQVEIEKPAQPSSIGEPHSYRYARYADYRSPEDFNDPNIDDERFGGAYMRNIMRNVYSRPEPENVAKSRLAAEKAEANQGFLGKHFGAAPPESRAYESVAEGYRQTLQNEIERQRVKAAGGVPQFNPITGSYIQNPIQQEEIGNIETQRAEDEQAQQFADQLVKPSTAAKAGVEGISPVGDPIEASGIKGYPKLAMETYRTARAPTQQEAYQHASKAVGGLAETLNPLLYTEAGIKPSNIIKYQIGQELAGGAAEIIAEKMGASPEAQDFVKATSGLLGGVGLGLHERLSGGRAIKEAQTLLKSNADLLEQAYRGNEEFKDAVDKQDWRRAAAIFNPMLEARLTAHAKLEGIASEPTAKPEEIPHLSADQVEVEKPAKQTITPGKTGVTSEGTRFVETTPPAQEKPGIAQTKFRLPKNAAVAKVDNPITRTNFRTVNIEGRNYAYDTRRTSVDEVKQAVASGELWKLTGEQPPPEVKQRAAIEAKAPPIEEQSAETPVELKPGEVEVEQSRPSLIQKPAYTGPERRSSRGPETSRIGEYRQELLTERDPERRAELQQAIERESAIARGEQPQPGPEHETGGITAEEVNKRALANVPEQGNAPNPGTAGQIATKDLNFDPRRFQYKTNVNERGVTNLLAGKRYNPELAGEISVWRDPADGKLYVINGHHRAQLAVDSGQQNMRAWHIDVSTAEAARARGALQNIADGRGTAVDAAKFFRDSGMTSKDLDVEGISLGEATASNGLALSRLDPSVFEKVATGQMTEARGVAIGEATADAAQQEAIVKLIEKQEARGRRITNDTISELARFVANSGNRTVEQGGLFGSNQEIHSLALEKAEASAYIKQQIAKERRTFAAVATQDRAQTLSQVKGQQIKATENAKISQDAAQAEEAYNKLSSSVGPVSNILEKAARDLASGNYKPEDIKRMAYQSVREEIRKTLSGGQEGSTEGLQGPTKEQPVYSKLVPDEGPIPEELRRGASPEAQQANPATYPHMGKDIPKAGPIPQEGTFAAVRTDDGQIFTDRQWKNSTHILFMKRAGIPPDRVVDAGWVKDGVYEPSGRSDAGVYAERARATKRAAEKRGSHSVVIDKAVDKFGVTDDPLDAGYILPDGRMLDFNRTAPYSSKEFMVHSRVEELYPGEYPENDSASVARFLRDSGAVRMDMGGWFGDPKHYLTIHVPEGHEFTSQQRAAIDTALSKLKNGEEVVLQIGNKYARELAPRATLDSLTSKASENPMFAKEWGTGMAPGELDNWIKAAGKNLRVEERGEQNTLFGEPEKMYQLTNQHGERTVITESQLKSLSQKFPNLASQSRGVVAGPHNVTWDYQPPEAKSLFRPQGGTPTLTVSSEAMELMHKVAGLADFSASGMNISKGQAERIAAKLSAPAFINESAAARIPKGYEQVTRSLGEAIGKASNDAGDSGVHIVMENTSEHVTREEQFHGELQRELGEGEIHRHLPEEAATRLLEHPAAAKLTDELTAKGYSKDAPGWVKVAEISAKIATGDLGQLTPSEAADWFDNYLSELHQAHGEQKVSNLVEVLHQKTQDIYNEARQRINARETQTRPGPGEGEGRLPQTERSLRDRQQTGPPQEAAGRGNQENGKGAPEDSSVEEPLFSKDPRSNLARIKSAEEDSERDSAPLIPEAYRAIRKTITDSGKLGELYTGAVDRLLEKLELGKPRPEIRQFDPDAADLALKVDAGGQYHKATSHAIAKRVTVPLSEDFKPSDTEAQRAEKNRITRDRMKGFFFLADAQNREYAQEHHPEDYQRWLSDPKIAKAVTEYQPFMEDLRNAVKQLGGKTIDEDYIKRVMDFATGGIDQPTVTGQKSGAGRDYVIGPQVDRSKARKDNGDFYWKHGVFDFGPSFEKRWIEVMSKLDEHRLAVHTMARGTRLEAGDQQPAKIYYNGQEFYRPDIAKEIEEVQKRGPSPESKRLADELGVSELPAPKKVQQYAIYEPLKGSRFENAAKNLASQVFAGAEADKLKASAGQVTQMANLRYAVPKEIADVLQHYRPDVGKFSKMATKVLGPVTQLIRQQIIGLAYGIPHMGNILRKVMQSTPGSVLNPKAYANAWKVAFSKELKARAISGPEDPGFDSLLRNAGISEGAIPDYKHYIEGNFDLKSWDGIQESAKTATNAFREGGRAEGKVTVKSALAGIPRLAIEPLNRFSEAGHHNLFKPGGIDQRARLWLHDFLADRRPDMSEADRANAVNETLGRYNRAAWTDVQKGIAPFMLFPGWDYSSISFALKHPYKTAIAPAVLIFLANQLTNALGGNQRKDKNDLTRLHFGRYSVTSNLIGDNMGRHMWGWALRGGQAILDRKSPKQVTGEMTRGLPGDVAGVSTGTMNPIISAATSIGFNRMRPGANPEIAPKGDYGKRGHVPGLSKATEDYGGYALRKGFPIYDMLHPEGNTPWFAAAGRVGGVNITKEQKKKR